MSKNRDYYAYCFGFTFVKKLPHGHLRYVGNCEGGPSSTYEQCLEDAFKNSRKIE